jgi:hypothetical protein
LSLRHFRCPFVWKAKSWSSPLRVISGHQDRENWKAAQAKAGALDEGGVVSHLSARTLKDLTSRYAYLLSFLAEVGKLNQHGPAAASVTAENILLYVGFLEPRVSSVTLAQSLKKIAQVAVCLAPERDWGWLRRIVRRLALRAKPRDRRNELVEIKEIYRLVANASRVLTLVSLHSGGLPDLEALEPLHTRQARPECRPSSARSMAILELWSSMR